MELAPYQKRRFWQDTLVTDSATVVVEYAFGMLLPTVYVRGGGRFYPAAVPASLFVGPDAADEREWEMGLISAALGSAPSAATGVKASDPAMEKRMPTLHAFMTETKEDGKDRSPSSLVVFTEDGQWKACLTEKDANLKLWRSADTFEKVLQALEKALSSGQADWRKGWEAKGQAKKGKRS